MNPLQVLGLEAHYRRVIRQITRKTKRERKAREYYANGLNGPRAMARRARQWRKQHGITFGQIAGQIVLHAGAA